MRVGRTSAPLAAACLLTQACLPIPHSERVLPALGGTYVDASGRPVAGARVAVTTVDADSSCAQPRAQAVSDERGTFALPAVSKRERLLFLSADMTMHFYRVCAGRGETFGVAASHFGFAPRTSTMDCVEWAWEGATRVTCDVAGGSTLATGGRWTSGDTVGTYRVIAPDAPLPGTRRGVWVQWLAGPEHAVAQTAALPCSTDGCALRETRVAGSDSVMYLRVLGGLHQGDVLRRTTYRLGAPGVVAEVPGLD